jgi:hypothetical protein
MRSASSRSSARVVRAGTSAAIVSACPWWPIIPRMNRASAAWPRTTAPGSSAPARCAGIGAPARGTSPGAGAGTGRAALRQPPARSAATTASILAARGRVERLGIGAIS